MHICRISSAFAPLHDGMSHHALYLSQEQVKSGNTVTVFQPHMMNGLKDDIRVRRVSVWPWSAYGASRLEVVAFCLRTMSLVWRAHHSKKFEVIHLHGDWLLALAFGCVGRLLHIPTVLTIHAELNQRRLYTTLAPLGFGLIDWVIAVSPRIRDDLCKRLKQDPNRISVISSGIHWHRLARKREQHRKSFRCQMGLPEQAVVIVTVGTLTNMKGQSYLGRLHSRPVLPTWRHTISEKH